MIEEGYEMVNQRPENEARRTWEQNSLCKNWIASVWDIVTGCSAHSAHSTCGYYSVGRRSTLAAAWVAEADVV